MKTPTIKDNAWNAAKFFVTARPIENTAPPNTRVRSMGRLGTMSPSGPTKTNDTQYPACIKEGTVGPGSTSKRVAASGRNQLGLTVGHFLVADPKVSSHIHENLKMTK